MIKLLQEDYSHSSFKSYEVYGFNVYGLHLLTYNIFPPLSMSLFFNVMANVD